MTIQIHWRTVHCSQFFHASVPLLSLCTIFPTRRSNYYTKYSCFEVASMSLFRSSCSAAASSILFHRLAPCTSLGLLALQLQLHPHSSLIVVTPCTLSIRSLQHEDVIFTESLHALLLHPRPCLDFCTLQLHTRPSPLVVTEIESDAIFHVKRVLPKRLVHMRR